MIAETELALIYGLRFPERMPRIPTVEVGTGSFPSSFATHFWSRILDLDLEQFGEFCRRRLGR